MTVLKPVTSNVPNSFCFMYTYPTLFSIVAIISTYAVQILEKGQERKRRHSVTEPGQYVLP